MLAFRYRDKGTVIHKLNPFCKLLWVVSVLVFALIFDHPVYLLLLFLSTMPVIIAATVWREWLSVMKLTLYLCIAIVIINMMLSYHGSHVLLEAPFRIPVMGTPTVTLEAMVFGLAMSLRLLAIISAFAVLTFTIHPDDLMLSMIKMKLPYKSVLVTSLSTRFIPTLVDDLECISDVQRSRGLELDKGKLPQRIKSRMSIMIPLLCNALDRAVQVSEAMESLAFGSGTKRTFYKEIRMSRVDVVTLTLGFFTIGFGIFMCVSGFGDYQYYPTLEEIDMSGLEWSVLSLLILLLLSVVMLAFIKRSSDLD
ncbi:MAG: energy-coupling factor transporter transmembrane protein EcfT [Dehalococcoidia bacterium]|nr:energy-coupling factor transporter transmembrane protein EcfT [Dehalococcoidia bacterium]